MATATIVKCWQDTVNAYVAATVNEGPPHGLVEYQASTPLHDSQGNLLTTPQLKVNLTAALSAARNASLGLATSVVAGVSGTVTV